MPLGPLYLLVLADACAKLGQADEGLCVIDETMAQMEATGARVWLSEVHRLKGQLLLLRTPADTPSAEASFREALAIARQQLAQAWELQAATSLARLLAERGGRAEAREILGEAYGRFTEGFETANLTAAKTLLAALS